MEFKFYATITPDLIDPTEINCAEGDLPAAIYPMIKIAVADRPNGNFVMFTSKSAANSGSTAIESTGIESLVSPYPKPILHHHDMHSAPVGRILASGYRRRQRDQSLTPLENMPGFVEANGFFYVVAKITDPATIAALVRGELVTVSIGVNAKKLTCSITGDDILENFKKGNWPKYGRGEEVDGKTCVWIIDSWEGREVSFVNEPAEPDAFVLKLDIGQEAASRLTNDHTGFSLDNLILETDYIAVANAEMIDFLLDGFNKTTTVENPYNEADEAVLTAALENNMETPTREQLIAFIVKSGFFTADELQKMADEAEGANEEITSEEEVNEEVEDTEEAEEADKEEEEVAEEEAAEDEVTDEEIEEDDAEVTEEEAEEEIENETSEEDSSIEADADDTGGSSGGLIQPQKSSSTKKVYQRPRRKSN